jgi:prophage tail gpP-like protein
VLGWPKPSEVAVLTVGGTDLKDWETVSVRHAVGQPSYTARFTCSEGQPLAKDWAALRIRPGMECTITLGGELALSGTIFSRQVYYDATRVHIELQAVSYSHKTQTTSVSSKNFEWKDATYQQFAQAILKPAGVQFQVMGGALPSDKFERINVAPGTSIWDALDHHARPLGIALTSNIQGAIVALVGPIGGGADFREGENILVGREIIYSLSNYKGTGFGQRTGNNEIWGAKAAQLFSKESAASSSFMSGGAMPDQLHQSEIPAWSNILKGRITTERSWNSSDEVTVFVTVQGWMEGGGSGGLYERGKEYTVYSPMLVMYGDSLKAKSITFTQDNSSGTRTTLELCNELAFGKGGAAIGG